MHQDRAWRCVGLGHIIRAIGSPRPLGEGLEVREYNFCQSLSVNEAWDFSSLNKYLQNSANTCRFSGFPAL